mgnify:CR=1 FL=1
MISEHEDIYNVTILPNRNNRDYKVDTSGRKLIKIMNEQNMIILNGMTLGDTVGNFTHCDTESLSTLDYGIVSASLHKQILYFKVHPFVWYSDHAPIEICVEMNIAKNYNSDATVGTDHIVYVWDNESAQVYCNELRSESFKKQLQEVMNNTDECKSVIEKVSELYKSVARKCLKIKKDRKKSVRKRNGAYSKEVQEAKYHYKKCRKALSPPEKNMGVLADRRLDYIRAKCKYKKIVNCFKNSLKDSNLKKLANIEKSNPRQFWRIINTMVNCRTAFGNQITMEEW